MGGWIGLWKYRTERECVNISGAFGAAEIPQPLYQLILFEGKCHRIYSVLQRLPVIDLRYNMLSGTIPADVHLPWVVVFNVSGEVIRRRASPPCWVFESKAFRHCRQLVF
ncbi:hypothetical protein ACLOJK_014138 [Asimina triloba]